MRPSSSASVADRRVRPVFLIVVAIAILTPIALVRGQTTYIYTAETEKPTGKKGAVTAGALKWDCAESRCTITGTWSKLGVTTCQSLGRAVGRIKSFGRPGAQFDATELARCNAADIVVRPGAGFLARAPDVTECGDYGGDCDGDLHNSVTAIGRRVWNNETLSYELRGAAGDDCDDNDPDRYPGNPEHCDADGHDEDCNSDTVGTVDQDNDGHIDASCVNRVGSQTSHGDDCNDSDPGVHPGSPEVCNGYDDDCNGLVDASDASAGLAIWVWEDRDRDGFGRSGGDVQHVCPIGDMRGSATNDYDCDDTNPRRHPGAGCP